MATNTLNASVKLETRSAVKSLQALENRINRIQKLVNSSGTSSNRVSRNLQNATSNMKKLDSATQSGTRSANQLAKGYQKTSNAVSVLTKNLRTMISTYVGIMGIKAVTGVSDTITSAKNQLNNMEGGNPQLTRETLDKTYSAAQRSRGSYTNMLSNVGKTMTLAGDAFQNNVDNAIRFQEIMSKAYTIGGASAAEQSSSMYQLVQALGSGILQGDELRSVREGAPIAYKQIEKFCQGVLNTTDSLKDLASQGVITSDMVVAAIMNAEEEIETKFKNTTRTFAQAFDQIKNTATKAFEPVLQKLNSALNSKAGQAIINGICDALVMLANITLRVMNIFGSFFNWFTDNWYWIQWIVYAVVTSLIIHLVVLATKAIWTGLTMFWSFLMGLHPIYKCILAVGLLTGVLVYLANTTGSAVDFMINALMLLGVVAGIVGAILNMTWLMWVGIALLALALILYAFQEWGDKITGGIYVVGAVFVNVFNWIRNVGLGLWESMKAIGQNIGIAFENGWIHAQNAFWTFISAVLKGIQWLEPAINAVAQAFGKEGVDISGTIANIEGKKLSTKSYVSVGDAWSKGYSTYDYKSLSDAYSKGTEHGAIAQDWLESKLSTVKNAVGGLGDFSLRDKLSSIGDKLSAGSYLPDPYDQSNALGGAYDPSGIEDDIGNALKKLGNIEDNTDSLKLTSEDVEYLRKIAESEWKKEFTTAEIKVDMTNYNTINDSSDLDGIFTKLSEELLEELNVGADGVYA